MALVVPAFLVLAGEHVAVVGVGQVVLGRLEACALPEGFAFLGRTPEVRLSVEVLIRVLGVLAAFDDAYLLGMGVLAGHGFLLSGRPFTCWCESSGAGRCRLAASYRSRRRPRRCCCPRRARRLP